MTLKDRLRSDLLLRKLINNLKGGTPTCAIKEFTPYFQYKIGTYQNDYYLYFTKMPNCGRYKNDIYNKLDLYDGYHIVQYAEFHYNAYADKEDFLRFLRYETTERLKKIDDNTQRFRRESLLDWVKEKEGFLTRLHKEIKTLLSQEADGTVQKKVQPINGTKGINEEEAAKESASLTELQLAGIVSTIEEKLKEVTGAYVTGNIQLNNRHHEEKLLQLFYLIQTLKTSKDPSKGAEVFKQFNNTDLASLLHLHFEPFKGKKINTLQKKISSAIEVVNLKSAKVQKLNDALIEFFCD